MGQHTPLPPCSVAVVLGTRPEIVKLAAIVELLGDAARVVHTGQHYDREMSAIFFDQFGMRRPDDQLEVGGDRRAAQIGSAIVGLDRLLALDPPRVVVVQGDTNTTVAAALVANALEIPLAHVEAGLRSHDRRMPEEHNRVVADHLADLCLAPTETARHNLLAEGIGDDRTLVTGNTVVEAVQRLVPAPDERKLILEEEGLTSSSFVLATLHRPENVDNASTLATILEQLTSLDLPVVFPIHPRTQAVAERHGLTSLLGSLRTIAPLGYREFLGLAAEAALLISDSGGVQEEVSVLKRPLVVVRRSTERPEVIGTFASLVEPGPEIARAAAAVLADLGAAHERLATIPTPYGDVHAPARAVEAIVELAHA